jgi:hypothetical protein
MPQLEDQKSLATGSIGFRIPPDVKRELQVFADMDNRTLSGLVKDWLYVELERRTNKTFTKKHRARGV